MARAMSVSESVRLTKTACSPSTIAFGEFMSDVISNYFATGKAG